MKTIWHVTENNHKFNYPTIDNKFFSTEQKAKSYIEKRVKEIMLNREDSMTIYTHDHYDDGYVGVVWTDENGNIKRGDWGEPMEHTYFWCYESPVDEES